MDQIKTGKFIAERRKANNLTQMQLAEKLGITDRAVSKWETGRSMPDASIMLELCEILKITVNDLLSGEVVIMENYNKELENNLLEMIKQKEKSDKKLVYVIIVLISLLIIAVVAGLFIIKSDRPLSLSNSGSGIELPSVIYAIFPILNPNIGNM